MDTAKQISRHSGYEKSKPISIPASNSNDHNPDEYSLKQSAFDPSESSPPNDFMIKLYARMNLFNQTDEVKNVDNLDNE